MSETMIQKAAQKSAAESSKPRKTMQDYVKTMQGEIAKALPSVITPERFTRMVLSAISVNHKLAECTPQSFLGAMMTAAQLGVEPNTALGQAYIIPYRNHGVMEAQFQLGYKGLIDLAYRSGEVSIIQAQVVHQNDEFEYELGLDPKLQHKPATHDRGAAIAYYAIFKTRDGGYGFEVMSVEDVTAHAKKYSKAYSDSPWQTNFDEMAKKTVLKRVLKYAPLKSEFARSLTSDESIKTHISEDMYAIQDETMVLVDEKTGEVAEVVNAE